MVQRSQSVSTHYTLRKRRTPFVLSAVLVASAIGVMVVTKSAQVILLCSAASILGYNWITGSQLAKRFGSQRFSDDAIDCAKVGAIAWIVCGPAALALGRYLYVPFAAPTWIIVAFGLSIGFLLVNVPQLYAYAAMTIRRTERA